MMRIRSYSFSSLSLLALILVGCGGGDPAAPLSNRSVLAITGDMPYGATPTDTVEFDASPAYIAAINSDKDVSMVLHTGDIHSGKQYCTQTYNASIYSQWSAFKVPLVYTPGDNEWADCHKKKGFFVNFTGIFPLLRDNPVIQYFQLEHERYCAV